MWFDRPLAQVAATGIGKFERLVAMEQWTQEHDNTARPSRRRDVHVVEFELGGRGNFKVVVAEPPSFDADTVQNLDDAIDFFYPGDVTQSSCSTVQ